ncbi:MAG: hypothetical protein WC514_01850 [Candidatus Paceibacterota bacterium]
MKAFLIEKDYDYDKEGNLQEYNGWGAAIILADSPEKVAKLLGGEYSKDTPFGDIIELSEKLFKQVRTPGRKKEEWLKEYRHGPISLKIDWGDSEGHLVISELPLLVAP